MKKIVCKAVFYMFLWNSCLAKDLLLYSVPLNQIPKSIVVCGGCKVIMVPLPAQGKGVIEVYGQKKALNMLKSQLKIAQVLPAGLKVSFSPAKEGKREASFFTFSVWKSSYRRQGEGVPTLVVKMPFIHLQKIVAREKAMLAIQKGSDVAVDGWDIAMDGKASLDFGKGRLDVGYLRLRLSGKSKLVLPQVKCKSLQADLIEKATCRLAGLACSQPAEIHVKNATFYVSQKGKKGGL
ncbi:MAG: hypothetical protein AAF380_01410 [Bacteroidota bacterium]